MTNIQNLQQLQAFVKSVRAIQLSCNTRPGGGGDGPNCVTRLLGRGKNYPKMLQNI